MTPKIAKIPFAETGWLETAPSATQSLQIVALQRRVRFSARLAGFCRGRCHQRRARRAELASFSVLVSNLDFRVPRLRQIGKRALTGPCGWREKRPGLPGRSRLARSGPGAAARASLVRTFGDAAGYRSWPERRFGRFGLRQLTAGLGADLWGSSAKLKTMLSGNCKTARMVAHYSAGAATEVGAVKKYL